MFHFVGLVAWEMKKKRQKCLLKGLTSHTGTKRRTELLLKHKLLNLDVSSNPATSAAAAAAIIPGQIFSGGEEEGGKRKGSKTFSGTFPMGGECPADIGIARGTPSVTTLVVDSKRGRNLVWVAPRFSYHYSNTCPGVPNTI